MSKRVLLVNPSKADNLVVDHVQEQTRVKQPLSMVSKAYSALPVI